MISRPSPDVLKPLQVWPGRRSALLGALTSSDPAEGGENRLFRPGPGRESESPGRRAALGFRVFGARPRPGSPRGGATAAPWGRNRLLAQERDDDSGDGDLCADERDTLNPQGAIQLAAGDRLTVIGARRSVQLSSTNRPAQDGARFCRAVRPGGPGARARWRGPCARWRSPLAGSPDGVPWRTRDDARRRARAPRCRALHGWRADAR